MPYFTVNYPKNVQNYKATKSIKNNTMGALICYISL